MIIVLPLPLAEASDDILGQRLRSAARLVDQHQGRAAGRGANAVPEYGLGDGERGVAEPRDRRTDLDRPGPSQLAQEIDLGVHQDKRPARHANPEVRHAEHRPAAGLEIGGEHDIVDVALRIEVAEADDVGRSVGKVLETRHVAGRLPGLIVHGSRFYAALRLAAGMFVAFRIRRAAAGVAALWPSEVMIFTARSTSAALLGAKTPRSR